MRHLARYAVGWDGFLADVRLPDSRKNRYGIFPADKELQAQVEAGPSLAVRAAALAVWPR